jgi:pimeloyl-ACP methyl ester carboxylesterase
MKKIGVAFLGLLVALGVAVLATRSGALNSDAAELQRLYATPPSQFIEIDGTRIHYRDEGQGPLLVLMHGSRGSLHQWDGWVRQLGARYRIVRFDLLAHGLTSADARQDYSSDRQLFLMHALFDRLQLERFILGGTSSGSTLAVRYAAAHPERVERLVLSTVPLRLPRSSSATALDRAVYWTHDKLLGTNATDLYWRTFLRGILGNPQTVSPALVRRYRDLNNKPGQEHEFRARIARWYKDGGPDRDYALAAKIAMPVLIQWGEAGPVLPKELFCTVANAFTAADVRVITYPGVGHMPVLENPATTARDALVFMTGGEIGQRCAASAVPAVPGTPVARSAASLPASNR